MRIKTDRVWDLDLTKDKLTDCIIIKELHQHGETGREPYIVIPSESYARVIKYLASRLAEVTT